MTLEETEPRRLPERMPRLRNAPLWLQLRMLPSWAILALGYVVARILSLGILAVANAFALGAGAAIAHADGGSGLLGFLQSWDGLHYREIAEHGYPTRLPIDGVGDVEKNSWAFLPLYPLLVRAVMLTGVGFPVAAVVISLLSGAAATFALYRLLRQQFGERRALWAALFFSFGPMSFLFTVAYADGLFALLMFCGLIAIARRRWLLAIPFGVVASFAHPGAIALAAAIGVLCLLRLVRRDAAFPAREKVAAALAIGAITVAGLAWPVIAGVVTGDPSGYFDTETAWWSDYIGRSSFIPFAQWFIFSAHFLGGFGIVIVVVVLAGFAYWLLRGPGRQLGETLVAYAGSYSAYLVAVFLPQQSLIRMLLPLSPLLGHPALTASRHRSWIVLGASILLQPVGVLLFWVVWPP